MADGEVVFSFTADDKDAQKKLNQLRRDIDRTAKAIQTTGAKKSGITQALEQARTAAKQTADEIAKVQARINETTMKLAGDSKARRSGQASLPVGEYLAAKDLQASQIAERSRLEALQKSQLAEVTRLEGQEQKVLAVLEQQTAQLETQKAEAGGVERVMAEQSTSVMPQLAAATQQVSASMRQGFKSILRWGFGIRSTFILIRRLRSALKEGISTFAEQDAATKANIEGLKASLASLKVSWGAAFAPILNAVAPLLQKLISMLIAAANAVQQFFAALGGASSYKKVIANNKKLEDSYGGAGGAAEEAERQILGFDEINKLTENKGGGGGGGGAGSGWDTIDDIIDPENFIAKLAITFKDVFFEWKNLNPEQIAKKIITGLFGVLGAVLAITLGLGPGGVILMTLLGVTLGLLISTVLFDNDGKISKSEALNMVCLALNTLLGGVLGFVMTGSFAGAAIGATIGAGLWLAIKAIRMDKGNKLNDVITPGLLRIINGIIGAGIGMKIGGFPGLLLGFVVGFGLTAVLQAFKLKADQTEEFYKTEAGKTLKEIQDKVANVLEIDEDLKVKITSITGEVDDTTLVDLGAAQQLIDDIFTLNGKENLTSTEAELLRQKVEALNGLGLPGIQLAFDETTQRVTQTRGEVQGLLDDLLKQYQIEAMKEAYVESFKAQAEATSNMKTAQDAATQASGEFATAQAELTAAQNAYNAALQEYQKYSGEFESLGSGGALSEEAQKAQEALSQTSLALEQAKTAFGEAKTTSEEANTALGTAIGTYDLAANKVAEVEQAFTTVVAGAKDAGTDTVAGYAEKLDEGVPVAEQSARDMAQATLDAANETLGIASPSKKMQEIGEYAIEGFTLGIESKQSRLISAINAVMKSATDAVRKSVNEMKQLWTSDWGRPKIHVPVFSLMGMFDFNTGQAPQVYVSDWLWMAKGGIVDGATPFVAGESGKEAVIPLERNTEWIRMVASGIIDTLTSSNKLQDYISNMDLPSVMQGQIVPPRALNGGGFFTDGDIERLVSGITAAISQDGGQIDNRIYLDGRQIAEVVTKHQRRMERGFA